MIESVSLTHRDAHAHIYMHTWVCDSTVEPEECEFQKNDGRKLNNKSFRNKPLPLLLTLEELLPIFEGRRANLSADLRSQISTFNNDRTGELGVHSLQR